MPQKPEHRFQQTAWVYLRRALPGAYVVSIDNGFEAREYVKIARHARGILSGQPDIRVLFNGHSIDFECKYGRGDLTEAQQTRGNELQRNGGHVFTVRSLKEIEGALRNLGLPVRATAPEESAPPPKPKRASKPRAPRADAGKLRAFARLRAKGLMV